MHVTAFLPSIWQNNACYVTHKESKTSQIRVIRFMRKNKNHNNNNKNNAEFQNLLKSCRTAHKPNKNQ